MKNILIILALTTFAQTAISQEQFPIFTDEALIKSDSAGISKSGEYKLLVYGAIGCSYSKYLINNLNAFDNCQKLEIIILLNDTKDAILNEYPELIKRYRVYSNDILKYRLTKNNDITPQTFLFKNDEQLLHVKGVKKKMFVNIDDQVNCKE